MNERFLRIFRYNPDGTQRNLANVSSALAPSTRVGSARRWWAARALAHGPDDLRIDAATRSLIEALAEEDEQCHGVLLVSCPRKHRTSYEGAFAILEPESNQIFAGSFTHDSLSSSLEYMAETMDQVRQSNLSGKSSLPPNTDESPDALGCRTN